MKRFLILAAILGITCAVVRISVSVMVFHRVDLRYTELFLLVGVPSVQSTLLCIASRDPKRMRLRAAIDAALARRALAVVAIADIALITLAVTFLAGSPLVATLLAWTSAVKGALAAAVLAAVALRGRRFFALVIALGMGAWALHYVYPWIAAVPGIVRIHRPLVIQWLIVFALPYLLTVAVLTIWSEHLRGWSPAGSLLCDTGLALSLTAAAIVAANIFFHPWLTPGSRLAVEILSTVMMTAFLASASLTSEADHAG